MSRLKITDPMKTTGSHAKIFSQINGVFGTVPNMFRVIGKRIIQMTTNCWQ